MKELLKQVDELRKGDVGLLVDKRINEFKTFEKKTNRDWFSELCFCLMTANWKAEESIKLQQELGHSGFCEMEHDKLRDFLKKKGHRFWPQRAERIVLARQHEKIKDIIQDEREPREWLVYNIKGLGYKEASHFLRNVGYDDYAIVDFHIVDLLVKEGIIEKPKSLTKNKYLEIEKVLKTIGKKMGLSLAELDLYLWYLETGKILK
ncbi:MAG: N-glycosylase/DNA lyase [archaeon]